VEGVWPLIGREEELDRLGALLRRGEGGVVIAGDAGIGRSRLGSEALALAEARGAAVARIAGTRALANIPLGAFAPLLPSEGLEEPSRVDTRSELLRRYREHLTSMAGDRRLVLLIDDAHLLDDLSAGLLQQLLTARGVFVIACVDTGSELSEPIVRLWKDDSVERIDLAGLDPASIGALLESVLGGPVDPAAVHALAGAAQGNLVFLRELVRSAIEAGAFRDDIGVWRVVGALPSSNRLAELVQARLVDLSDAERDLLEIVAFGEPLTVGELPGGDLATLEVLERRALVSVRADGDRTEVRLAHAAYGQVVRDRMPMLRARQLARLLGDAVEATGMRRRDDLLRVAAWRLDGGGSRPELMLDAALVAQGRYDLGLAERLVRRAMHLGSGFDAAFLAAQLAGQQGRREQAEAELADLATRATTDRERGLVAAARLDNVVFSMGHVELGLEMAREAESTIEDPVWRAEITAKRASVLGGVEGPRAAVEVAEPLLSQAKGRALVWASIVASYGLGRLGRLEQAREVSIQGHVAHLGLEEPLDWFPWRLVFFDAEALGHLGRLDESHKLAETMYREAIEDGSLEAQAWFAWQMTKFVTDRGYAKTAATFGRLAVALFRQLGATQYEHFALGDLAAAFAIGGLQRESRETLQFMDGLGLPDTRYWAVNVLQARAWTEVAHGGLPAALRLFREAAQVGQEIGDLVGAASSLHAEARLGSPRGVEDRLESLAHEIEGPLVRARLEHVRALTAKDAVALEGSSATFRGLGAHLLAAEAQADAATAWRDLGDPRRATAATRQAAHLAVECEGPATPALTVTRTTARLTPAERTAALLAANGRTSRQIAEELAVSVRTVENHLQHVYEKLGIRGRRELRALVDRPDD
jgi:DNA-binding CsgD family transcriptional regulator